jgi:anti-sigma28 factor (negative regulator of flagellin synthesis)
MTTRISSELYHAIKSYAQQHTPQLRQRSAGSADTTQINGLPSDRIDLSPQAIALAKDLVVATRIIRETDISGSGAGGVSRKDRIEELAAKIGRGEYNPPSIEVAERVLPALKALDDVQIN